MKGISGEYLRMWRGGFSMYVCIKDQIQNMNLVIVDSMVQELPGAYNRVLEGQRIWREL